MRILCCCCGGVHEAVSPARQVHTRLEEDPAPCQNKDCCPGATLLCGFQTSLAALGGLIPLTAHRTHACATWSDVAARIPAHGPVHLLQIRSHAQKHFQKLIKNGQRHEVPDARAKRPVSPGFKSAIVSLTLCFSSARQAVCRSSLTQYVVTCSLAASTRASGGARCSSCRSPPRPPQGAPCSSSCRA
jgi:hypothetical protein